MNGKGGPGVTTSGSCQFIQRSLLSGNLMPVMQQSVMMIETTTMSLYDHDSNDDDDSGGGGGGGVSGGDGAGDGAGGRGDCGGGGDGGGGGRGGGGDDDDDKEILCSRSVWVPQAINFCLWVTEKLPFFILAYELGTQDFMVRNLLALQNFS